MATVGAQYRVTKLRYIGTDIGRIAAKFIKLLAFPARIGASFLG